MDPDSACLNCRLPPAAAAETQATEQTTAAKAKPPASQKGSKTFNEKDFVLEVPRGFIEEQSPEASDFGAGGRPKSTYGEPMHTQLCMRDCHIAGQECLV
jgi:hypothetical protein